MTLFYNVLVEDEAVQSTVSWNARCELKVYSLVIEQDFLGVYTLHLITVIKQSSILSKQ